jgi:hypothetical protein
MYSHWNIAFQVPQKLPLGMTSVWRKLQSFNLKTNSFIQSWKDCKQKTQRSKNSWRRRASRNKLPQVTEDCSSIHCTGILSVALFAWLLSYVSSDLPTSKVMSAKSVFLCILLKLRLNLHHQDLAYRFNVSLSTISDIFNQSLPIIAKKLCF